MCISMTTHQWHLALQSQKDVIYHYYYAEEAIGLFMHHPVGADWHSEIPCPLDMVGKKRLPIKYTVLKS